MAKYLDQNGLLYFWQQVKTNHIDTKVDKVEGKGLSTNDLTNDLLGKINGMGTVATLNEIGEANLSAELLEKVNASAEGNHSHSNKGVLDGITEQNITDWNDAVAKEHEHANKAELDLIATGDKAKWDQAAADLDTLEAAVGTVPEGKTVVGMIAEAQEAATYDDTELAGRVKAIEDDYLTSEDKYDDTELAGRVAAIEGDYLKGSDKTALEGKITAAQEAAEKVATDFNTAMDTRVKAIEGDYLKAADKTELTEAIATAKQEAIEAVLDGVTEDFDTLKEVAAWIQSDTTNSTALINRVSAIEADYLKAADKTALQDQIDTLKTTVDTGDKTVSAYVEEAINAKVVVLSNSEIDTILAS